MAAWPTSRVPPHLVVSDRRDAVHYLAYVFFATSLLIAVCASFFISATGKMAVVDALLLAAVVLIRLPLQRRAESRLAKRVPIDAGPYAVRDKNFDRLDLLRRACRLLGGAEGT
jgi:hypothetical protein